MGVNWAYRLGKFDFASVVVYDEDAYFNPEIFVDTAISCPFPCIEFNSVHESGRRIRLAPKFIYFFF